MLDALKNLKYLGGKEGLLLFFCDVVGTRQVSVSDAEIICSHLYGKQNLSVEEIVKYCSVLGWIQVAEGIISVSPDIIPFLKDKEKLNDALIKTTVKRLFDENIMASSIFSYDSIRYQYIFKNELFPLSLSGIRNVLISQGFLIPQRETWGTHFYLAPAYDSFIAKYCKAKRKQLSLEELKKQLENNEIIGEKAELFVLEFEKNRLGGPLAGKVRRISEVDVTAGYDIISYNSVKSKEADRFIEVKAISSSGFYWSKNEYETAKLKGETYYLYLVDLHKINQPDYVPEIVQNPAVAIMESEAWLVEAQSYSIRHI